MKALAIALARRLPGVRGLLDARHSAADEWQLPVASDNPMPAPAHSARHPLGGEHFKTATAEDIFYCFRLLLGRNPNLEEWPGHSSRAGKDLETVVSSYVTSREFAARGLLNKTYRDRVELVHFPRFSIFASDDDLAIGHHVIGGRAYEPGMAAILERYVRPDMAVVDIGANIGCLTMLLASLVGASGLVVAVEPNPGKLK